MIEPYYQEKGITIYNADCREVLPQLSLVDLVLTDPPYGISYNPCGGNGLAKRGNLSVVIGDSEIFDPAGLLSIPARSKIIWGGNHFADQLPATSAWLVWYKRRGIPSIDFADCEIAWTDLKCPARVFDHLWHGMLRDSERGQLRYHPTQKPTALMAWCIGLSGAGNAILDPFCGSGTTLLAAKKLGRSAIGIEISEEYCAIAVERLRQNVLDFTEPLPEPERAVTLFD